MIRVPRELRLPVNDVELAVFVWEGSGPPLVFAHGNSFHARCWDQVIAGLPGRLCYAIELRGHGRSSKPAPPYRWRTIGGDVAAVVEQLGLRDAVGIGHSLGGHALALAGSLAPAAFGHLILLDPVILPPALAGRPSELAAVTERRRNTWSSPEEMLARFQDRPPFAQWDPAVLRDYCTYGLLPDPAGGGYVLACPPAIEASIYRGMDADIYAELATIQQSVAIIRAHGSPTATSFTLTDSPTNPDLVNIIPHATDAQWNDCTHFIPMEAPARVASLIG